MKPITEATLLRSINLLLSRNSAANKKCEQLMRDAAQISQNPDADIRKKFHLMNDVIEKLSKSIQRRECKLKKLKAKMQEINTMQLV